MGKKRKNQNQKEKRAKKRREKEQWEATPILEKTGMVSFKSAGDRTEQTKEGRKKRQMEEDVFEASESSDSDLEISEGLHRDFEKSSQWGKSLQMLKKMGWKEGEGLGRKQKGMVQQPDLQDIQLGRTCF